MDIELVQCDRESRHMATADYWPDILEKLDDKEAENARRTTWYNERGQHYHNKKARHKDWERVQRREQIEEGMRRADLLPFSFWTIIVNTTLGQNGGGQTVRGGNIGPVHRPRRHCHLHRQDNRQLQIGH